MTGTRRHTVALDASASTGTVAILEKERVVAEAEVVMRKSLDEQLLPAILDALSCAGGSVASVERVVCGAGPGSFTSLRVAGALAKGLAMGQECPLFGVPSLALIVAGGAEPPKPGRWLATLDAMRGDRYLTLVTVDADGMITAVENLGLAPVSELAGRAAALDATLIGAEETVHAVPHARGVARMGALLSAIGPSELGSWEPIYGRLAEAQVKWEAAHGRALGSP